MAKIFPERLRNDVKSPAERLLYRLFHEQLSDHFTVFHQVRWQVRNLHSGARDGEADFVIACPKLGILVIEVKGGIINYQGTTDQWYSNNHPVKDPFKQACDSKHSLLSRLKELHYWRRRWIPIGHAVAFPDVEVNGWLPLHSPHQILLDSRRLRNLSGWVQSALNYWLGQNPAQGNFDANGIKELIKILSPSITPRSVMVSQIGADEKRIADLTEQQIGILDFLREHRRVAISGCAGSGKTLLALEKARRLHEQEFSVLLTCYNKSLKDLMDAADQLNWRVDAVIVDEGQDFCENWWLALKLLLNDPDNGIFYFFYDNNQNIYNKYWQPPLEEAPFSLTKNCRNTQKIHSYVLQFHCHKNSSVAFGPVGQDVEIVKYTSDTQLKQTLGRILHRLVIEGKVAPKDIVILTTRRKQSLQNQIVGQFRIKADPDFTRNEILCNTIHYFKGLESQIVILIETAMSNNNYCKKLLYVGSSRARNHLIVLRQTG